MEAEIKKKEKSLKKIKEELNNIAKKWQKKWENNKIFEAEPSNKKKFFVNFPYPYVNGFAHLGHLFSSTRTDVMARYKRLKGYNVLYPQGFHATGQPILAAAKLVKEKNEKQIKIMIQSGVKKEDIPKFEDPKYWIKFFSKTWIEDLKTSGCSIDWRRKFITTELNPPYDKFIKWQYNKLNENGNIIKSSHAVVYCPNCKYPIGDHDRKEGEGVTPEEVTLIKFYDENNIIYPAMTFRPETTYGVTNLWVKPEETYILINIKKKSWENEEKWIISKDVVDSFKYQLYEVKIVKELKGEELIGKIITNPVTNTKVPILPAEFVNTKNGTGVVMSVPAHAPYDYIALEDLKNDKLNKYKVDKKLIPTDIISLIKVDGYGEYPAKDIVEKLKIKNQNDEELLKKATKEIYKKEFHKGILRDLFGKFKGLKVSEAKEKLIQKFIQEEIALKHYILMEKVVCRCNTEGVVSIIQDQYFLNYSNKKWKERAHKCVDKMRFYPKETRENYHYTIDWLKDWACARDKGIGTRLPWDNKWLIESLSDSTIYMSYYTISHYLQNAEKYNIDINKIDDTFFDYIFLNKGTIEEVSSSTGISKELLKKMKNEFDYWYEGGYDFRNSGKDLIQNHLTFSIFHHTAIFPEKNWPSGISVNGYIMLDGQKMSKSKGNFITFRQAIERFGIDSTRFASSFASDSGLDDANFDTKLAETINSKLYNLIEFAKENYNKGIENYREVDYWFEHILNETIEKTDREYDNSNTRTALQYAFFDLNNAFKWYARRINEKYNKYVINRYIEAQILMLSPVIPHFAEEVWYLIRKNNFVSLANWPKIKNVRIDKEILIRKENLIKLIREDFFEIKKMLKKEPDEVKLFISKSWKYKAYVKAKNIQDKKSHIKELMQDEEIKKEGNEAVKYIQQLQKVYSFEEILSKEEEIEFLKNNIEFLEKEFNCKVKIIDSDNYNESKAKRAEPMKPGIMIS